MDSQVLSFQGHISIQCQLAPRQQRDLRKVTLIFLGQSLLICMRNEEIGFEDLSAIKVPSRPAQKAPSFMPESDVYAHMSTFTSAEPSSLDNQDSLCRPAATCFSVSAPPGKEAHSQQLSVRAKVFLMGAIPLQEKQYQMSKAGIKDKKSRFGVKQVQDDLRR